MERDELHGLHIEETNLEHHEDNDLDMDAELGDEDRDEDDDLEDDLESPFEDDGQPDEAQEWDDFMGGDEDPISPFDHEDYLD